MRYLVRDEEGNPFRKFWTLDDAKNFCNGFGWFSIEKLPAPPKPPKIDMVAEYGEAPY